MLVLDGTGEKPQKESQLVNDLILQNCRYLISISDLSTPIVPYSCKRVVCGGDLAGGSVRVITRSLPKIVATTIFAN